MRTPQGLQATVSDETVKIQDRRLILQAQLRLELPMPEQDADLPGRLEAGIERGGQALKRRLFRLAVEQADAELILSKRHGKRGQGITCRGTTPLTFKTVFGTVEVRPRGTPPKADGPAAAPSAPPGQTPRQVVLTAGLRQAACDGLLRDSAQQVVARIDARADETGVLAKATVLEIVHEEGQELQAAAHARAEAVYERDPEALRLFVPTSPQGEGGAEPEGPHDGEAEAEDEAEAATAPALIGFAGGPPNYPEVERDHPREVDPGVVLVSSMK